VAAPPDPVAAKGFGLAVFGRVGGRSDVYSGQRPRSPMEEKSAMVDELTARILGPIDSNLRQPPPQTAAFKDRKAARPTSSWAFARKVRRRISGNNLTSVLRSESLDTNSFPNRYHSFLELHHRH
jgi:hypothetical protein